MNEQQPAGPAAAGASANGSRSDSGNSAQHTALGQAPAALSAAPGTMAGMQLLAPPHVPQQFMPQMFPPNQALVGSPAPSPLPPASMLNAPQFMGVCAPPNFFVAGMTNVMGFNSQAPPNATAAKSPAGAPAPVGAPVAPAAVPSAPSGASSLSPKVTAKQPQDAQAQATIAPAMVPLAPAEPVSVPGGGSMLGGVPLPPLTPHSTSSMQVQVAAAAAAAAAAVPPKGGQGGARALRKDTKSSGNASDPVPGSKGSKRGASSELTPEEKARQNRDRNREHARSTRLRKKAYVSKLKELVEGLHAERTEEARKRRVAVQHLAEMKEVRKAVVRSFLKYHLNFERDPRKWMTLLEDQFWFKQPVTPYRSFRRVEIEQECRMSRGVEAMIADAASMSVMVEGIGSRSARWMQVKREDFLLREEARNGGGQHMPHSIVRQNSRLQHAVSSLSSSSGSSTGNGSGGEEERQQVQPQQQKQLLQKGTKTGASGNKSNKKKNSNGGGGQNKVSSSSSNESHSNQRQSNDYHDYHAPSLPDPMLDSGGSSGGDSPTDSRNGSDLAVNRESGNKHVCTDSSSGDEEKLPGPVTIKPSPKKRRTHSPSPGVAVNNGSTPPFAAPHPPINPNGNDAVPMSITSEIAAPAPAGPLVANKPQRSGLPANIARSGGISHNIKPIVAGGPAGGRNGNVRLNLAPAIPLPPFIGIGKRASTRPTTTTTVGAAITNKINPAAPSPGSTSLVANSATSNSTGQPPAAPNIVPSREPSVSKGAGGAGLLTVSAGPAVVTADNDSSSTQSSTALPHIQAYYHVNEDDMLLTDDVLMCPFIFRSQDAVLCGALAECVMPGMLRAHFSPRNKLLNLEMVYDAMGFMQQLERASGSEGTAQIVPNSLEMALSPNTKEARVITFAKAPFLIVSVNEAWTRITKYTQMEVEGKELSVLNGKRTDKDAGIRPGKPVHNFADVAGGNPACSVNVHYDKLGRDFVDYICSYPLTNANDEITHILHVFKELPIPAPPDSEFQDTPNGSVSFQRTLNSDRPEQ